MINLNFAISHKAPYPLKELPEDILQIEVIFGPEHLGDEAAAFLQKFTCQLERVQHKEVLLVSIMQPVLTYGTKVNLYP